MWDACNIDIKNCGKYKAKRWEEGKCTLNF